MFVDGLKVSRMTLHIHRVDMPDLNSAEDECLSIELSPVQMNAIAAALGLGYREGELLYYRDEDVTKNIERKDGFGIQANYHFINCDSRRNRISKKVRTGDSHAFDSPESCNAKMDENIMQEAASVLGLSFADISDSDGIVDIDDINALDTETGEPAHTDSPFSSR